MLLPLSFNIDKTVSWLAYCLDNQANITIAGWYNPDRCGRKINMTLTGLSDGSHSLVVYANDTVGNIGASNRTCFTVDAVAPNTHILLPENRTYNTSNIPLTFTVTEPSTIGFSLDGKENVTVDGNTTLSGLLVGSHSLVVYANDTAGNIGASETIHFSIEPFPTTLVVASVASIAVISIGLLVYFRKRKR